MKLFVWENVLSDYTDGLVVVQAHNENEAWRLLYEKDNTAWWDLNGKPRPEKDTKENLAVASYREMASKGEYFTSKAIRPMVADGPIALVVWGGA